MFSFLNRKKKDELDYGNPVANAYNQQYGSQALLNRHNQSVNQSRPQQSTQQQPYAIQQMADGRVRYSDGSIRGQKTVTPTTYQQPKLQPKPQPKPQPTQPTQTSLTDQYLQNRARNAQQRVQGIKDRSQEQMDLQKELAGSRQNTLQKIGDISGESFNTYADQLRQGLGIQRGTAERQVGTAKADYYDQQRQREQARQERMKGLEGTLASLGTLQSSAMGNLGAKINEGAGRQDAQAQRQLNTRVADIQDQVRLAENEVETLIKQEAANYRQQAAQLAGQMDENSIEYKQAVSSLADQADQRINGILDQLDQFVYNAQLETLKAQQAGQGEIPKVESDLRQELFSRAKEQGFTDVQNAYSRIMNADNSGFGDVARITSFMKLLDPGSVVRESEFRTAEDAAGYLQRAYGVPLKVTGQGTLTSDARRQLEQAATSAYNSNVQSFLPILEQYYALASQQGLDPNNVLGEYSLQSVAAQPGGQSTQQNQSVPTNDPLGIL